MPRSNLRLYVIYPKEIEESSFFWDKVYEGTEKAKEELEQFGVKVEYIFSRYNNVHRQAQILSQVIDQKPDGIAIVPTSTTELNLLIDEAVDNDIPVVAFLNDAPYSKRFCYVGPDNYSSGRLCGELMGNYLSGKGNVMIFSASSEVYSLKQRLLGFRDKMKSSYPEIKILKTIDYSTNEDLCYSYAMDELQKNTEIDGIFVTCATGTIALGRVLDELKPSSLPKVIGYDPNERVAKYVYDGIINALIYQDLFTQGYMSLKVLYNYLSSGLVPEGENLYTNIQIVMQENLENFIASDV